MSDVSVLSEEYRTVAELSRDITQALIALKKTQRGLPGADRLPLTEVQHRQAQLAELVGELLDRLQPQEVDRSLRESRIPASVVGLIRDTHRGDLTYYLADLGAARNRLIDAVAQLSDRDFAVLDDLAAAAETETAHVFRKLMRR